MMNSTRDGLASIALLTAIAACGTHLTASASGINGCVSPCDLGQGPGGKMLAMPADMLANTVGWHWRQSNGRAAHSDTGGLPKGMTFQLPKLNAGGEIEGSWEVVEGLLTFERVYPPDPKMGRNNSLALEILIRGYDTEQDPVSGQYFIPGWDRNLYWLDFDGDGPTDVPHLLPSIELENDYVPEQGDPIQIFVDDPDVQQICVEDAGCRVNQVPFVQLQEAGRDYSGYTDSAARASLYILTDDAGSPIVVAVEIFDSNEDFERFDFLYAGDVMEIFSIGYDLDDPDFLYIVELMEPRVLTADLLIELNDYQPGEEFADPDLPSDFNSAKQELELVLSGSRSDNGGEFGYGGPYELGYTWEIVPEHVFGSRFTTNSASPVAGKALVH